MSYEGGGRHSIKTGSLLKYWNTIQIFLKNVNFIEDNTRNMPAKFLFNWFIDFKEGVMAFSDFI